MNEETIEIHFLGAAETVTGSKYLVKALGKNILIDCGLFLGLKKLRLLNWEVPPIELSSLDAVLLTHGHMDHTGYLPRLVQLGLKCPVYGTAPTLEIARIILEDSAKIQEEEAERANREGYSKHKPAKPLYTLKDVEKTLPFFKAQGLNEWIPLGESVSYRHRYSGHILGATFIELKIRNKILVFSGDIGRKDDPLLFDPEQPEQADILFLESTYGDRLHLKENVQERLKSHVLETIASGGVLLIPSFAVERAQLLMYYFWQLKKKEEIPDIPVYMDSPMGADITALMSLNDEWDKLTGKDYAAMSSYVKETASYKDTLALLEDQQPKVVIAGSGMVNGGRILTYLTKYISRPSTTLLLAGFQAEGTLGRLLLEGAEEAKIYGTYYPVKAKVDVLQGLSAHADQQELLAWMGRIRKAPGKIFLVHGEPHAADALRVKIKDTYGWEAEIPSLYQIVTIAL